MGREDAVQLRDRGIASAIGLESARERETVVGIARIEQAGLLQLPDRAGELALVVEELSEVEVKGGVPRFDLDRASEMMSSALSITELDEDHGQELVDRGVTGSLAQLAKEVGEGAGKIATVVAGPSLIEQAFRGRSSQQRCPAYEYANQMNRVRQNINFSENCTCLGALASLMDARLDAWMFRTGIPKLA